MKFPVAAIILAAGLVIHGPTATAQFAEGDLVVIRVGTGSASLSSASTPVFLDEYRTGGLRVRSLPMPQAENGGQQPFTLSGNATSEGGLSLSKDGRFLVCAGYGAAPGISAISSSSSSSVNRVVARTDATVAVAARGGVEEDGPDRLKPAGTEREPRGTNPSIVSGIGDDERSRNDVPLAAARVNRNVEHPAGRRTFGQYPAVRGHAVMRDHASVGTAE